MKPKLRLPDRLERFHRWYQVPETLAVILGLLSLALELGIEQGTLLAPSWFLVSNIVLLAFLVVRVPVTFALSSTWRSGFIRCGSSFVLYLLAAFGFLISLLLPDPAQSALILLRSTLFLSCLFFIFRLLQTIQRLAISPFMILALSYSLLILIGAGLLMLPRASVASLQLDFIDALFMSASASCVTGLTLFDIGKDFTLFGQLVILSLIQIGGLGIMTFAAFVATAFGSGMSIRDRVAMGKVLNYDTIGKIGRLIVWILALTLICELLGAFLLYGNWRDANGSPLMASDQVYYSIFYSISAFCNAGFSLHSDSLVRYQGEWPLMLPMSLLILVGGLGFAVIMDLIRYKPWHHPLARRLPWFGKRLRGYPLPRLSLQTKLVLSMTTLLMLGGSGLFWLLESNNTLADKSIQEQIFGSFFQGGVTPRTAGFNSLDFSSMLPSTQYVTVLLMVIGASPGSTGGGLKTTSIALLLLALYNTFRGRPIEVFKRRIHESQIRQVLVMLVVALIMINGAVFLLSLSEENILKQHLGFEHLVFEVVSAFATVGLSTGITTDFSNFGKIVLAICMFAGRIGPMTLVMAIGKSSSEGFDYPRESVMLG